MRGVLAIIVCWLVGNTISFFINNYVSGNVIGMVLMYLALKYKFFEADTVRPVAKFLLGIMGVFFVPYGVGLLDSYDVALDNIWGILTIIIIATPLVLVCSGYAFQILNRKNS